MLIRMSRIGARTAVSVALSVVLVALACLATLGPARHLGATADEGAHIAPGLQWWIEHRFAYEPLTPPVARIAVAFLPWLWGFHLHGMPDEWSEGRAVIGLSGNPHLLLLLARLGTLLFLVWSSAIVWLLGRRAGGSGAAAAAVACFVSLPPILGNAGIATTDLAQAATFGSLIYVCMRFVETPSRWLAALLGIAGALAVGTKFTSIAFFPLCAAGLLGWRRIVAGSDAIWLPGRQALTRGVAIGVPVMLLVIWAMYNFRVGSLLWQSPVGAGGTAHAGGRGRWYDLAGMDIYPANEFWRGLLDAVRRNSGSPPDYLFGRVHQGGSRLFVPVAFLLKTPVHFLLLTACGVVFSLRQVRRTRDWNEAAPWVAGVCVIVAAVFSVPHLGNRYLLSAYVFFAPTAGSAAAAIWNSARIGHAGRAAAIVAALWAGSIVIESRRDYLGWFNVIAGPDPTWFIRDGDTDDGQYGVFLAEELRRLGVTDVYLMLTWDPKVQSAYYGVYHDAAELVRVGMPRFTRLPPDTPVTGWVAITVESLDSPSYQWLKKFTPVAKVSYQIYIYHID